MTAPGDAENTAGPGLRAPVFVSRYTPDSTGATEDGRLVSPSFARNAAPIAEALTSLLAGRSGTVLEIGSGTGQHAAFFAAALAPLSWQPTDPDPLHRASIAAWTAHAPVASLHPPLDLDTTEAWWAMAEVVALMPLAAVYAQNVLHIAPWHVAEGIVAGAARALGPGGLLIFYGPFAEGGRHTGEGNSRFDRVLRAENPDWGVRDADDVAALAAAAGLVSPRRLVMPSNNRILVFEKG